MIYIMKFSSEGKSYEKTFDCTYEQMCSKLNDFRNQMNFQLKKSIDCDKIEIFVDNKIQENFELLFEVRKIVESYMIFDEDSIHKGEISFVTREHGDEGMEEPGTEDIEIAEEICLQIKNQLNATCKIDTVDEWVYISVKLIPDKELEPSYSFLKHTNIDFKSPNGTGSGWPVTFEKLPSDIMRFTGVKKSEAIRLANQLKDADYVYKKYDEKSVWINMLKKEMKVVII